LAVSVWQFSPRQNTDMQHSNPFPNDYSGREQMAIGSAVEMGSLVYVYDENRRELFTKPKGIQPGDGLKGYTSTRVSIKNGFLIYTYDDKGRQVSSTSAR
jgi:hypothetical protein